MAQEQAKSPSVESSSAKTKPRTKPKTEPEARAPELQRRASLTERLRAEQRKSEPRTAELGTQESKTSDLKLKTEDTGVAADLGDAAAANAAAKPITRSRRPAGPAQRRITTAAAANDDVPSIGGLIFALQQRPSRTPFVFALFASIAWFVIGGYFAYGQISNQIATGDAASSASALTAAMTILVPIAIFWFLSLLVWRAQELRLMASAMTEVAVRLAEPDKLAEQSVASLGQTIRRQVAAMNDAISRAIGRASELEALVHNEVAALERSYSENEVRVRGLISELASEREALANNSQRVSEALKGVGAQVSKDISVASGSIDKKLAERGLQLTELLVARSNEAADQVQKAQAKVAEHVPNLLDRLTKEQTRLSQVIEGAAKNLSALETVVGERANALDKTLKERTEALTASLATRIKGLETAVGQGALVLDKTLRDRTDAFTTSVSQNAGVLDKALKDRTDAFTAAIAQNAGALDKTLKERTETFAQTIGQTTAGLDKTLQDRTTAFTSTVNQSAIAFDKTVAERAQAASASLTERLRTIDSTFGQHVAAADKVLSEHTKAIEGKFGEQSAQLNQLLANSSALIKQTAEQVGSQSKEAIGVLTNQTQALRDVSRGLLEQIHSLTQRFENQGQAILTAAKALDSSNTKIDSILESRHQAIIGLLHTVNTKAQDLDNAMRGYAGTVENSLVEAETKAKQVGAALARDTAGSSATGAGSDRALARGSSGAHVARRRRSQGQLRVGDDANRTSARADARPVRHHVARHARCGAADRDRSRPDAPRDAAAHGQPTAADGASHRRDPQSPFRAAEGDRGNHARAQSCGRARFSPAAPIGARRWQASTIHRRCPASMRKGGKPICQSKISARWRTAWRSNCTGAAPADRRSSAGSLPGQIDNRMGDRRREQRWSVGDLLSRASEPEAPAYATPRRLKSPAPKACGSTRSRAPSTRARRQRSGSASAPESAACWDGISTATTDRQRSTRLPGATTATASSGRMSIAIWAISSGCLATPSRPTRTAA